MKKQKISVIGLGYVGLPLLCAIAKQKQYDAVGYNRSDDKIKKIVKKKCPIDDEVCAKDLYELDVLNVSSNPDIMKNSDIIIVCVPTPVYEDYTPNYEPIKNATAVAAKYLRKGDKIVIESTVNPGTCEEILIPIVKEVSGLVAGKDYTMAFCPERINPGDPKWNVYNITRNIGAIPTNKTKEVADFYRSILNGEIHEVSNIKVAEASKIIENSFRDVNIAFVNELAQSFDVLGIDLIETLKAASNKPFSFMVHFPSRGVGGHCIAVDPYYLIHRAEKSGFNHLFLKTAREVNNSMPKYLVSRLQEGLNEVKMPIKGTKIGLFGLSYKANVGDLRESPCLVIQKILKSYEADLLVFDPYIPQLSNVKSLDELLQKSTAIILGTMHDKFKGLEEKIFKHKNIKVIADGMNKLDKEKIITKRIIYKGIGR